MLSDMWDSFSRPRYSVVISKTNCGMADSFVDSFKKLRYLCRSSLSDFKRRHTVGSFSDSHDFSRFHHSQFQRHSVVLMEILCELCQD